MHELCVSLSRDHPRTAPVLTAALPKAMNLAWDPGSSTLSDVIVQFETVLAELQEFWDALDLLDERVIILDPQEPSRSHTHRRIAMGQQSCIEIKLDPLRPSALPQTLFLGAESVVQPLERRLYQQAGDWSDNRSILENLTAILGLEFPKPSQVRQEAVSVECGVCYAFMLGEEAPTQACDNLHCGQVYHTSCIVDWLKSLPSVRQSFNTLFGECPYCSEMLSVCCKPS